MFVLCLEYPYVFVYLIYIYFFFPKIQLIWHLFLTIPRTFLILTPYTYPS